MALPQKAIEQLGREPVITPGWSSRLLLFSSTLFFLSLAIYFGISFGYVPYIAAQVEEFDQQIAQFNSAIPLVEQERLIGLYSQAANLRKLLNEQELASTAFPWIEQNTHKDIFFGTFALAVEERKMLVKGKARTIEALAEQVALFQSLPEITKAGFSGTSVDRDGLWSAEFVIEFQEGFFLREAPAVDTQVESSDEE